MFTGRVGPVEVFFYWTAAVLVTFYWPWAIGPLLALSPASTMLMGVQAKNFKKMFFIIHFALCQFTVVQSKNRERIKGHQNMPP